MERYSTWRDSATGISPLLVPLAPSESAPKLLLAPIAFLRTTLLVLLLLLHWILVEGFLSIFLFLPSIHRFLSCVFTTIFARSALAVCGFLWIREDVISLRKTSRTGAVLEWSPGRGDVIISNSSSVFDLLYLACRYNPAFILPLEKNGSIVDWKRVSLLAAIRASGNTPHESTQNEPGESLEDVLRKSGGPVVVFPECTTSNNRALLRIARFTERTSKSPKSSFRSFIISLKYEAPTGWSPSPTSPIPAARFNPLPQLFRINLSPIPRQLVVRKLQLSETPRLSATPKQSEWEAMMDLLAQTGRWKRTAIDWEAKVAFEEFRKKRR